MAFVFGLTLIGGAFLASRQKEAEATAAAARNQPPVRSFIAVADNDKNGSPDWQDSLNIPTVNLNEGPSTSTTMTKTAALAVALATQSHLDNGGDATAGLSSIGQQLVADSLDRQYGRADIKVGSSDSQEAWRAYGNRVAAITFENALPAGTENELTLLNRSIVLDRAEVLEGLDPTITAYEGMLADMLATAVPPSLVKEHLSLINVYNAILVDVRAFRNLFTDALPAMTRLRRYQADTEALYLAISNLYLNLDQKGIKWSQNDDAAKFIKIE